MLLTVALIAPGLTGCSGETRFDDLFTEVRATVPGPITAMATLEDRPLIGTYDVSARPRAGLATVADDGTLTQVPVRASSPYAFEGRWRFLAVDGDRIAGVTGISGGAHGNVRWAVWRGLREASEEPQTFETFGGIDAGALTGVAIDATGALVTGSWKSPLTGLDAAIWRPAGLRWVRADSAGSALASGPEALVQVSAVATHAGRAVLAGARTDLSAGARVVPVVWTEQGRSWIATDLPVAGLGGSGGSDSPASSDPDAASGPASDSDSNAAAGSGLSTGVESISCGPTWCLLAGRAQGRVRTWLARVDSDGRVQAQVLRAPRLPATDRASPTEAVPDTARFAGSAVGAQVGWLAMSTGAEAGVLWRLGLPAHTDAADRGGGWSAVSTPGSPSALTLAGGHVWLATSRGDAVRLWLAAD